MSSLLVRAVLKCPSDKQMCWSNRCPKVSLDSTHLEEEEEELLIISSPPNKHGTAFTMRNFFDSYPTFICTNTWCGKGLHFSLIWIICLLADQSILHEKCALTSSFQLIAPFRCLNEKLIAVIVCSLPSQRVLVNAWDLFLSIILSHFKNAFSPTMQMVVSVKYWYSREQNRTERDRKKAKGESSAADLMDSSSHRARYYFGGSLNTPAPYFFFT